MPKALTRVHRAWWPVIAGIGATEILLAWRWQRSGRIVTRSRDQRP